MYGIMLTAMEKQTLDFDRILDWYLNPSTHAEATNALHRLDGYLQDLFDEYSEALKTIGKPLNEKYVLAKIAGNEDFFRGMNAYDMYKNVDEQIEKILNNGWNVGIDKNPEIVPLAVLFQDKYVINMMSNRKYEFTLFDENERRKLVNISAMDRLLKKYRNARVFFLKDSVAEFDFYLFKKEQEEAEEKMKKSNDKILENNPKEEN